MHDHRSAFSNVLNTAKAELFCRTCSCDEWTFHYAGPDRFSLLYEDKPFVTCENNQITDVLWGHSIGGVSVSILLQDMLREMPQIHMNANLVRTEDCFTALGYTGPPERLSLAFDQDRPSLDRAWAINKPCEMDSGKSDYIAYWDQGNSWCEVFGVFEGVTRDEFLHEIDCIVQREEQERSRDDHVAHEGSPEYSDLDLEEELAFSLGDGKYYFAIQTYEEGYDYTIYNGDYSDFDGGQLDNPELTMGEAVQSILESFDLHDLSRETCDYEELMIRTDEVQQARIAQARAALKPSLSSQMQSAAARTADGSDPSHGRGKRLEREM